MGEAPIFQFNEERESIVEEVVGRVSRATPDPLLLLNDAAYHEIRRLEAHPGSERAEYERFRDVARTVGQAHRHRATASRSRSSRGATRATSRATSTRGCSRLAPRCCPARWRCCSRPKTSPRAFARRDGLQRHLITQGPVETLRALSKRATLVFVPTHLVQPRLGGLRLRARPRGPAPGELRRGQEPLQPTPFSRSSCRTSAPTASTAASATSSTRRC
jgi:glycerol-3-phosphate O-acyltransferase